MELAQRFTTTIPEERKSYDLMDIDLGNPIPLIDGDVLAYACAFLGEEKDEDGNITIHPFSSIEGYIEDRVEEIMEAVGTTTRPFMFLTGDGNFRYDIATVKPYKDKRPPKPYHLPNVRTYIRSRYNTYVSKGCEADDLLAMAMHNYRRDDIPCVLCTVDKDLLQVEGWHYRWETWNSGEVPLHFVDSLGKLTGEWDEGISEKTGKPYKRFLSNKFKGEGYLWFLSQILTGDTVDNIPGLEGCGAKKAYEVLKDCRTKAEGLHLVTSLYKEKYEAELWEERLVEQARLVYMIQERDKNSEDGLKHWTLKGAREDAK